MVFENINFQFSFTSLSFLIKVCIHLKTLRVEYNTWRYLWFSPHDFPPFLLSFKYSEKDGEGRKAGPRACDQTDGLQPARDFTRGPAEVPQEEGRQETNLSASLPLCVFWLGSVLDEKYIDVVWKTSWLCVQRPKSKGGDKTKRNKWSDLKKKGVFLSRWGK